MGVAGSKFRDKNGNRVIILRELRSNGHKSYALANLDDSSVSIDYNAQSLGIAISHLSQSDWNLSDDTLSERGRKGNRVALVSDCPEEKGPQSAGLVKGMQDTVENFYKIYNQAYLDQHGFSKLSVFVMPNSEVNTTDPGPMITRFSLKIKDADTPFLGVRDTDVVEYMGKSRWKFIKNEIAPDKNKKPEKAILSAKQ